MDVEACRKQWSEIAARISGYAIPSAASAESQIRRADESYQNQLGVVRDALAAYDYVSYDNSVAIGSEKYRRARKDTWQKFLRTVNEFRPFGSSTSHGSVFEVTLVSPSLYLWTPEASLRGEAFFTPGNLRLTGASR